MKHYTANANLVPNGPDFIFFGNTAGEFNNADSGASTDEPVSWPSQSAREMRQSVRRSSIGVFHPCRTDIRET